MMRWMATLSTKVRNTGGETGLEREVQSGSLQTAFISLPRIPGRSFLNLQTSDLPQQGSQWHGHNLRIAWTTSASSQLTPVQCSGLARSTSLASWQTTYCFCKLSFMVLCFLVHLWCFGCEPITFLKTSYGNFLKVPEKCRFLQRALLTFVSDTHVEALSVRDSFKHFLT